MAISRDSRQRQTVGIAHLLGPPGGGATGGAALGRDPELVARLLQELRPQCGEGVIASEQQQNEGE